MLFICVPVGRLSLRVLKVQRLRRRLLPGLEGLSVAVGRPCLLGCCCWLLWKRASASASSRRSSRGLQGGSRAGQEASPQRGAANLKPQRTNSNACTLEEAPADELIRTACCLTLLETAATTSLNSQLLLRCCCCCCCCCCRLFRYTRTRPLKVRLVHRELASQYSAYSAFLPASEWPEVSRQLKEGTTREEATYHLVFSYDPAAAVSAAGILPFRYLEGQSVAFFNLPGRRGVQQQERTDKPRLYSVASSLAAPELGLANGFSLCVRHHLYWGPDGKRDASKDGLCSASLCTAPLGSEFDVGGPIGAALLMPEEPERPLLFVCTGTGVAPLRSFLRRITAEKRKSPVTAYIGAPTAATTPYAREWQQLQRLLPNDLLRLHFAHSREMKNAGKGKLYVQHLIERDGDELLRLLEAGAIMYACGRKDMLPPIKAALQAAAARNNVHFDAFFRQLLTRKQWRTEVY
ncbi:hypothetical protein Efla_004379 [Eimeria flavescens]